MIKVSFNCDLEVDCYLHASVIATLHAHLLTLYPCFGGLGYITKLNIQ